MNIRTRNTVYVWKRLKQEVLGMRNIEGFKHIVESEGTKVLYYIKTEFVV